MLWPISGQLSPQPTKSGWLHQGRAELAATAVTSSTFQLGECGDKTSGIMATRLTLQGPYFQRNRRTEKLRRGAGDVLRDTISPGEQWEVGIS